MFPSLSAPYHPAHAVWCALLGAHTDRVLIGACNPMVWPIWGLPHYRLWPVGPGGKNVLHCFNFDDIEDVLFTSFSRVGMLNGNGHNWYILDWKVCERERERARGLTVFLGKSFCDVAVPAEVRSSRHVPPRPPRGG